MAKNVRRSDALRYISQAEEFLASARQDMDAERHNAATFNAVQSMINGNDALTVYFLEKRASTDHREGLKLHADVVKRINDSSQRSKLKDALDLRSQAGYLGESISKAKAYNTVKKRVNISVRKMVTISAFIPFPVPLFNPYIFN